MQDYDMEWMEATGLGGGLGAVSKAKKPAAAKKLVAAQKTVAAQKLVAAKKPATVTIGLAGTKRKASDQVAAARTRTNAA